MLSAKENDDDDDEEAGDRPATVDVRGTGDSGDSGDSGGDDNGGARETERERDLDIAAA